ncbi:MAG: DNA-directed RNA polymerase subunit beta, partial [Desulfatiglandales bacterium]
SWLDFEFDPKDHLYVRIDKRRKFPVTLFLKALGLSAKDILYYFYGYEIIEFEQDICYRDANLELLNQTVLSFDILNPDTSQIIAKKGDKYNRRIHRAVEKAGIKQIPFQIEDIIGKIAYEDIIDPQTGEIIVEMNQPISLDAIETLRAKGIKKIKCMVLETESIDSTIRDTLLLDKVDKQEDAILEIYRKMRPSSPATLEVATAFFNNLFFNLSTYDLSRVGRLKLNHRLGHDLPLDERLLRTEDVLATIKELIRLKVTQAMADDIDSLANRRIRTVGELLENQYRIGLVRMERAIKEKMTLHEIETLMPHDLVNSKPVTAVVKEFFGTSQLSQFMDQTNPLSELTHKRRLSALGPGGLTRERAGFEVRDVHPTHYGRICPVETPEGPNIGLIVSLGVHATVNEFGFIETPYRKVDDGKVTDEVAMLSALEEKNFPIAQANAPIDEEGRFLSEEVAARVEGEASIVPAREVRYMDVSPTQLVSVSASLIPFLEHDDANRALMGSNMQRQAVPLIKAKAPLVGTGMERIVVRDTGTCVIATKPGIVEEVDATRIVVASSETDGNGDGQVQIYRLTKYKRSNQNSCYNQRPIVKKGDRVLPGQVLADGPSSELGELALGENVFVAFMPWGGYNFEDSVIVSERMVREDIFTSIHIEEYEVFARDTKLGREEITRDIPNLSEEALKNLDESGIVKIGAEVKPGDILVGKITPKGETQLSPEEKLLRAIFGEKAGDVKDTSLRVPPGVEGIVIDTKVFSRRGVEKDARSRELDRLQEERLRKDLEDELLLIKRNALERLKGLILDSKLKTDLREKASKTILKKANESVTEQDLRDIPVEAWLSADFVLPMETIKKVEEVVSSYIRQKRRAEEHFNSRIERLGEGDELPPGVVKMVKVYLAVKRKLSVGDKMAGRHGNKGVVSRILPLEDMPYFADGTPVDVILNPLGVPSRMNVGQVLETHLGWASKELGRQIGELIDSLNVATLREKLRRIFGESAYHEYFKDLNDQEILAVASRYREGIPMASPVFDGATEEEIEALLREAGLPITGQSILYDGRTGEPFDQPVTVGVMYIMKLHHLVDDKIHARSIGPYSLVTQQPLGGKAQFGGQRLGEMEVWAIEAYGAAYSLQEFLTVKSDDVIGRNRMYERIVKGNNVLEAGLPESFKVLVKELQALALDVQLYEDITSE